MSFADGAPRPISLAQEREKRKSAAEGPELAELRSNIDNRIDEAHRLIGVSVRLLNTVIVGAGDRTIYGKRLIKSEINAGKLKDELLELRQHLFNFSKKLIDPSDQDLNDDGLRPLLLVLKRIKSIYFKFFNLSEARVLPFPDLAKKPDDDK